MSFASRLFFVLLLFLPILLCSCERNLESGPALLQVGERSLSLQEFRRIYQGKYPKSAQVKEVLRRDRVQGLLRRLIDRELILNEADRLGVGIDDSALAEAEAEARDGYPPDEFKQALARQGQSLLQWQQELKAALRLEKTINMVLGAQVQVAEAEVEDYYREHKSDFQRPEILHVRQILVADGETGQHLLGRLRAGEDFVALAREQSLTPEAELGGDLGWIKKGQLPPEVEGAIFSLPVGRVSDVISSPYGEHIFLVEERLPAGRQPLEDVAGAIRETLHMSRYEEAFQAWLGDLRAKVPVKIEWQQLADIE